MYNRFEVTIDQTVVGVSDVITFQTGLGIGNAAITVVGIELEFLKPIDPSELSVFVLGTTAVAAELTDNDVLARVPVWNENPGVKSFVGFEQRQTVQRELFATLESYTAVKQKVRAIVYYEVVQLKEIEYLRLVAAGA